MLEVKITQNFPNLVLTLKGQLDLATGFVLREKVDSLDLSKLESLTFHLDGLDFIDSTGIGQLIGYYRSLAAKDVPVYIENSNSEIEEILQLIGVREIMELA